MTWRTIYDNRLRMIGRLTRYTAQLQQYTRHVTGTRHVACETGTACGTGYVQTFWWFKVKGVAPGGTNPARSNRKCRGDTNDSTIRAAWRIPFPNSQCTLMWSSPPTTPRTFRARQPNRRNQEPRDATSLTSHHCDILTHFFSLDRKLNTAARRAEEVAALANVPRLMRAGPGLFERCLNRGTSGVSSGSTAKRLDLGLVPQCFLLLRSRTTFRDKPI